MKVRAKWTTHVVLTVVVVACLMTGVAAQSSGRATGTVVDDSGGAIVGARVVVETPLGRTVSETTSGPDGSFTIIGLPPGEYVVHAEAPSFAPASAGVRVSDAGDAAPLRLLLRVAGFAETVPVRVSVDRLESPPDESPAVVRVVSRTQIDTLPVRRVFDALALMPNLDVRQAGGLYGEGSITMYGISGQPLAPTATVIAINGMPLNNGLVPETSLNMLPLVLVDRLEMVQGPGSSAYGSNAVIGVLNMTTRRPTRTLEGGATVTAASRWSTGEGAAYAGGGRGDVYHWLAGFSSATSDGHLQPSGRRDFSDATKTNVAFVADRTFARTSLSTAIAYLDIDEHNPDVRTPNRAQRLTSTRLHVNLGVTQTLSDQFRVAASYVRNGFDGQSRETFDATVYGFGQAAQRPSDPTDQTTASNGVLARAEWN
ncbi:MAG: TonB-dependent receptor plug domain-containing protein, partial [Gemmatimonas sp.]